MRSRIPFAASSVGSCRRKSLFAAFLTTTTLAFAVLAAPASAYLNVQPALFMAQEKISNDFRFRLVERGYPNNIGNRYYEECFQSGVAQIQGQGCYFRRGDGEIQFWLAKGVPGQVFPQGKYVVNVLGSNTCAYVVTHSASLIYWTRTDYEYVSFATTAGC